MIKSDFKPQTPERPPSIFYQGESGAIWMKTTNSENVIRFVCVKESSYYPVGYEIPCIGSAKPVYGTITITQD